jgi:hypothetical protein
MVYLTEVLSLIALWCGSPVQGQATVEACRKELMVCMQVGPMGAFQVNIYNCLSR